jgi:hypothetical protein
MTSFKEKHIWSWMKRESANAPKFVHLQRVESVGYPLGFPDVMVFCDGRTGFIELKRHTKTNRIKLSPQQKLFLQQCLVYEIPAYVATSDESRSLKILDITTNVLIHNKFSYGDVAFEWPNAKINWGEFIRLFN